MVSTKLYTAIYVVLFVFATAQVAIEFTGYLETLYWTALGAIIVLSFIKALLVAGYYQHMLYEPRSVTYLIFTGFLAAVALTAAAAYSIV